MNFEVDRARSLPAQLGNWKAWPSARRKSHLPRLQVAGQDAGIEIRKVRDVQS